MTQSPQLLEALRAVSDEVLRAQSIYGAFTSAHEGYAVLLEEVDELKAEVWKGPHERDYDAMRKEACQIAAMAVRIMIEIAEPRVVDEYRHVKQNAQQFCWNCEQPIDNLTGIHIMQHAIRGLVQVGSCCYQYMLDNDWQEHARARGLDYQPTNH